MPNDFYTRAYNPLPEQRVSSQVLKDEFARVEAGFDEVQGDADRAIKLPVGTADQTLAMDAGARANLVLAFNASGNITAISYGRYRGDWLTATAYVISDYFRDPVSKNIYSVIAGHTSGVLATDISAGRVQLAINVEDVEVANTAAQNAATTATTQAGVATTQAGTATTQAGVAAAQASTATTQAGVATTQAGIATTQAGIATTQAGIATTKAAEAAASAASIAGGPVPEAPSDGKAYARKDASWVEDLGADIPALAGQALKNLRVKSNETGVEWTSEAAPGSMARATKTSAYTLVGTDKGALIDCSGTWTLGLTAAATLGNGWWCYVRNYDTGDITLDPNSAETIDGLANFVLYPGAVRLVLCDGAALYSIPLVGGTKTFTTTGSYVWAPGIQQWDADLIAGGAGGGGGARAAARYNGGGGGAGERWKTSIALAEVTVGASVTCTVGAKGTGGAAASVDNSPANKTIGAGTSGGASSIGALRSAAGGVHTGNGGSSSSHGDGPLGGGKDAAPAGNAAGQLRGSGISVVTNTEWGGPNGRAGSDASATGIQALLGGQRGGRSGGATGVVVGTAGANGVNPGDGGDGGTGNINGFPAGKGGDGADGKITIVEVI
jgi:hypothetical protein